jgi:uncharacterized protein
MGSTLTAPAKASSSTAPQPQSAKKRYKILSLDGGGSWALIQARVLKDLYPGINGHEILKKFNLVAANSGGSLVLCGLVADMTPEAIEKMFTKKEKREQIFSDAFPVTSMIRRKLKMPRYSTARKRAALDDVFAQEIGVPATQLSNLRMQDVKSRLKIETDLIIPAFDYDRKRLKVFRSNVHSKANRGNNLAERCRLVEAAHASTNAPVKFFDRPAVVNFEYDHSCDSSTQAVPNDPDEPKQGRFWDGAIGGCNNPVMLAVTEALANGVSPANIVALSIGTGIARKPPTGTQTVDKKRSFPREVCYWVADALKIATTILDDPPDAASYIAHVALTNGSDGSPLVRMNPFLRPLVNDDFPTPLKPEGLKDGDDFEQLFGMEMDAARQADVNLIVKMTESWMKNDVNRRNGVPNQPIRCAGPAFERCVIGHDTYKDAKKAWRKLEDVDQR